MNYEMMVIVDPELKEKEALDLTRSLISEAGFTITEEDVWGLRALAYPVKKRTQGRYAIFWLNGEAAKLAGLKRELTMNDAILRLVIMKEDK